jgi:hypothetical protein
MATMLTVEQFLSSHLRSGTTVTVQVRTKRSSIAGPGYIRREMDAEILRSILLGGEEDRLVYSSSTPMLPASGCAAVDAARLISVR